MASGTTKTVISNIKSFDNIAELGISWSDIASTSQIIAAMPNNSMFSFSTTSTLGGDGYPIYQEIGESGSVILFKNSTFRAMGICIPYKRSSENNKIYFLRAKGENEVAWSNGIDVTYNS